MTALFPGCFMFWAAIPIQNGIVDAEGNLSFSGTLQVPFIGALPFTFEGTHKNDGISGTAVTKMGAIVISGTRV